MALKTVMRIKQGSVLGPLCMCYGYQLGGFMGVLTAGMGVSLTLLPAHEILFLLLGYLGQPQYEGFLLVLLCLVLSCLTDIS